MSKHAIFLATICIILIGMSSLPLHAQGFRPDVNGNLTDPANWAGGILPEPTATAWIMTDQAEALFMSQDLTVYQSIFFTNHPVSLNLSGFSYQSNLFMNRMPADTPQKSLNIKNGSLIGKLQIDVPISFENLHISGSLQSELPSAMGMQLLLKNVVGNMSNWSIRQTSFGTHEVLMNAQSNIDFGTFSSQRLYMTENSRATFDEFRTTKVVVDAGSKLSSDMSYTEEIEATGEGTEIYLGKTAQYSNIPITLNVREGAFVRAGHQESPPDLLFAPFRTITVDGSQSKVILDPSSTGVMMMRGDNNNHVLVRITDGAELEINGQLNVVTGSRLQVGRIEVVDAIVRGSLILSYSSLLLDNGLVTGDSLLLGGGFLDGHGTIDVPIVFLGTSIIDPDGMLAFTGSISGSSRWNFDIESESKFDQIRVGGGLLFSQNLFVSFSDEFRGTVGDRFDILTVDGNFGVGSALLDQIQISNIPSGYTYETRLDDHHLWIEITSVPEVGVMWMSLIGLSVFACLVFAKRQKARPRDEPFAFVGGTDQSIA
jgi:hypothetical protein